MPSGTKGLTGSLPSPAQWLDLLHARAQSASAWRTITNAFCWQENAGLEELSTGTIMPSFPDICFTDTALCCPPCQVKWPCFVWPTILFTPDIFHFLLTWRVFPPSPLSLNSERSVPEIQASSISWTPSIIGQQSSFAPPHIYCLTISLFWEYPSWIVPEVSCQTKTLWSFTLSFAGETFLNELSKSRLFNLYIWNIIGCVSPFLDSPDRRGCLPYSFIAQAVAVSPWEVKLNRKRVQLSWGENRHGIRVVWLHLVPICRQEHNACSSSLNCKQMLGEEL